MSTEVKKSTGVSGKLEDVQAVLPPNTHRPFGRRIQVPEHLREPGFAYHLTRNTPEDIDYRQAQGWEVVMEKSPSPGQPDGRVILAGRYVLMRMPKALHKAYQEQHNQESVRALRGPEAQFTGKAESAGFETVSKTRFSRGPMSQVIGEKGDD